MELGGWWAEEKTNVIRQISTRLDVLLDGDPVAADDKFNCPTLLTARGKQLSVAFGDARVVASHYLHPSDTVTSSWTVAAIGLEPATYTAGRYPIRGGTGCVSCVTVLTDSALAEGSLRLDAGSGGLRFSATEGAPWADAQAMRNDTPPASVGASRDFWLGASAGGSHTLAYSLRTPQGTACLSTNLAIEAIVAKFATNVYYVAHGDTGGILVDLSSASHDPAGFTLKLDGAACADGQPPWQVAVSNLTAGAHTLTVQSKTFPDLADEATLYVIRVDTIEVTSTKSGISVNPPPFEGHMPWPFVVTNSPIPDKHMVVFYMDVVDSSFNVQDFDVTLKASILPMGITAERLGEVWSKISGPASGSLNRADTFEVKFQNPKLGGVYRFEYDLGLGEGGKSEATVVLPLAGAEIDGVLRADLPQADAFATRMKARYAPDELQKMRNLTRWFWDNHAGDYTGRPDNADTSTIWVYNQVNDATGFGAVCTWRGRPVRLTKPSNLILGYAMQQIGISRAKARRGTGLFTITETTDRASVGAGWDVANGGDYDMIVSNLVDYIWTHEAENDKSRKLWPNPNPPDNYRGSPNAGFDFNTGYGTPVFLFMRE